MSMKLELQDLASFAEKHGWTVTLSSPRSGKLKWRSPEGYLYYSGTTPSDYRGLRNLEAQLRQAGLPRRDDDEPAAIKRRRRKRARRKARQKHTQQRIAAPAPSMDDHDQEPDVTTTPTTPIQEAARTASQTPRGPRMGGTQAIAKAIHDYAEPIRTRDLIELLGDDPDDQVAYGTVNGAIRRLMSRGEVKRVGDVGSGVYQTTMPTPRPEPQAIAEPAPETTVEPTDPAITKTGKVLTDQDFEALADEAERGYDVERLRERPAEVSEADDTVKRYLTALNDPRQLTDPGAIERLQEKLQQTNDFLERVRLRAELRQAEVPPLDRYEVEFVKVAKTWADANGVSAADFQAEGVPREVLQAADMVSAQERPAKGLTKAGQPRKRQTNRVTMSEVTTAVLAWPKSREPFSVRDLMDEVGSSSATTRKTFEHLIERGLLEKTGERAEKAGPGRASDLYRRIMGARS